MNQVTVLSNGKTVVDSFNNANDNDYLPLYQATFLELSSKIQRFGKLDDGVYVMYDKDLFDHDIIYVFDPKNDTITIDDAFAGVKSTYKYSPDFGGNDNDGYLDDVADDEGDLSDEE